MAHNEEIGELLTALRQAATARQWRECETVMFKLYPKLSLQDGMHIAIKQLAEHLETFEGFHPDINWVREWFTIIQQLKPINISRYNFPFHSETRMYDDQGSTSPGSSAFMDGITLMQEAFDAFIANGNPNLCLDLAKGVVGSSITARTFAYAAINCPAAWENARVLLGDIRITDEYSMEELEERNRRRGAYDECTNDYQTDLWLALADQLEVLLT